MDSTLPFASEGSGNALEPEYADVYGNWKANQTPQTKSELLRAVKPVISTAVKSYGGPSKGSPTLMSNARQLALKSFGTYDPARGSLKNHLLSDLRRLNRVGAQQAQGIRLPEMVAMNKSKLDEAEREMEIERGRPVSDRELSDYTGLSMKRIAYVRQARPIASSGQIEAASEDGSMPASTIPGTDMGEAAWQDMVYYDLGETDQLVFDLLLGRNGRKRHSVTEAAAKLGISPGAISQRSSKIQAMLDERYDAGVF